MSPDYLITAGKYDASVCIKPGDPTQAFVAPPTEGACWIKYIREKDMKFIEIDTIEVHIARLDIADIEKHTCQSCADELASVSDETLCNVDSDYSESNQSSPSEASHSPAQEPLGWQRLKWKFV